MVKVLIEVRNGATRFSVTVRAQGIREAVNLTQGRYHSADVKVKSPIDPEGFFVTDSAPRARIDGSEQSDQMAA